MRPRSVPAPPINCITNEPMLYKEPSIMESMYIPNNPQYGLQLEYTTTGQYPVYHSTTNFNGPDDDPIQFNGYSVNSPVQICVNNVNPENPHFEEVTNVLCDENDCIVDVSDLRHHQLHHTECGCPNDSVDNLCSEHPHHDPQNVNEDLCHQNNSDLELCTSVHDIQNSTGICANTQIYSGSLNNSAAQQLSTSSIAPYWATDVDMGTFSLPPLDLDPLPSLFPFSPCSANNFKSECINGGGSTGTTGSNLLHHHHHHGTGIVKQPHDMADVLLSLKHAVVHPGQQSTSSQGAIGSGGGGAPLSPPNFTTTAAYPQQSQLSYSMHPHQMLMSPTAYPTSFCDQSGMFGGTNGSCQGHQQSGPSAMFPSMSVNVSMNMTMHGYPPPYPETIQHQVTCPQMQWSTSPQNTSPTMYHQQAQGILSPSYTSGGTTYSFTADFRTPTGSGTGIGDTPLITTSSSFKPVLNKNSTFSQLAVGLRSRRQSLGYNSLSPTTTSVVGGPTKIHTGALSSEDESQRPNLCRICGKTYARPSTLKTHLRTHSGEKPYRCSDCNKSFSQAANLTAHVRTHSGEKPFRCPICDRRFSQSSSVTTHMRTHSGERPYRCRMCKKAFSDSSTLTKHLRIHSGEKPYQCKLCLLRFSQSGNLNRHMRVHGTTNNVAGATTGHHHQMLGTAG